MHAVDVFADFARNLQEIGNLEIGAVAREVVYLDVRQFVVDDLPRIEQRVIGAKKRLLDAFAGSDAEQSSPQHGPGI